MKKLFLIFSFLYLLGLNGFSQQYEVELYSLRDGLSQANVTALYQDSRGYIWIGTKGGGINRFDGKSFTVFNQEQGLQGSIIRDIKEDVFGNLYVATSWGGVSVLRDNSVKKITENTRDLSSPIALEKDSSNLMWIATTDHIGYYDGKQSKVFSRFSETFNENIVDLVFHPQRGLLVLSTNRIYQIKNFKLVPYFNLTDVELSNPCEIAVDDNGFIIVLDKAKEGIVIDNQNKTIRLTDYHQGLNQAQQSLLSQSTLLKIDQKGGYWYVSKEKGILHIASNGEVEILDENNGIKPSGDKISQILIDRENNLWIGGDYNGLLKMTRWPFISFKSGHPLGSPYMFNITKDGDNNLWVNTDFKNLICVDSKTFKKISHPVVNERVKEVKSYHGHIYVNTEKGIFKSKGTGLEKLPFQLPYEPILSTRILIDKEGNTWIGTGGKGIYKFNKGSYSNPVNIEVGNNYIHSLLQTKSGDIYVGTGSGLSKIEADNSVELKLDLCNSYVGQIAEDLQGNLWLATDNCLTRFDGEKILSYTVKEGLSSNTIYLTHCDKNGNIWSGTNRGLDKFKVDEDGNITELKHYNQKNGFSGIECNSRAVYEDDNGHIYFGTVYGLYIYNKLNDVINPFPPKLFITDFKVFLQSLPTDSNLTNYDWHGITPEYSLTSKQNHITISFKGIAHKLPSQVKYTYMLEGFDEEWTPLSDMQHATYSNLNPNSYTFKVKAVNEDGISSDAVELKLNITPPPPAFWQNNWFYIFSILIVSYLAFYFIFQRNYRLQRAKLILEQKIQERTREISKQNEEKAVMLKEIHHRVKNNLQIINSLLNLSSHQITDPETLDIFQECRNRINSMALIHEKMYEVKDLANIDIKEYITQLTENLVKTYQIDKKIELDLDLRVKHFKLDTLVPIGLIINESVSNSLKYAFKDVNTGKIFIHIHRNKTGEYVITIGDNGVGLPKDFDWQNSPKLGIQLIQILSEQLNGTVELNRENGTVYTIKFP